MTKVSSRYVIDYKLLQFSGCAKISENLDPFIHDYMNSHNIDAPSFLIINPAISRTRQRKWFETFHPTSPSREK
jgi:hypothetical protein